MKVNDDHSSDSGDAVDEGAEGAAAGQRGLDGTAVELPCGPYVRGHPKTLGPGMKGLKICALYANHDGEPGWFDGVIVDYEKRVYSVAQSHRFHVFFPEDGFDDWYTLPDSAVIYRRCNAKYDHVTAMELKSFLNSAHGI